MVVKSNKSIHILSINILNVKNEEKKTFRSKQALNAVDASSSKMWLATVVKKEEGKVRDI